jgi:TetR/AcrR family transcriptional regulator
MPKETFHNLPTEKQELLFKACVKEFSAVPYSQASINQIIKHANISRGSFYQYFNDKWDAYEMMFQRIGQEKLSLLPPVQMHLHFFDTMVQFFDDTMAWLKLRPEYYQIGLWFDYDNDEMIERIRTKLRAQLSVLEQLIIQDQADDLIDKNVDPYDLVEMIMDISKTSLIKAFKSKDYDLMRHIYMSRLNIIKKGVQPHV